MNRNRALANFLALVVVSIMDFLLYKLSSNMYLVIFVYPALSVIIFIAVALYLYKLLD